MFLLNVLDEVRSLVKESKTATAGEALGVTALQMMAVLVSDSRDNIRLVMGILSHMMFASNFSCCIATFFTLLSST